MRIAISVDDHLDVNKIAPDEAVSRQAAHLRRQGAAVYVNAGDTFNDFSRTRDFFHALQDALGQATTVRFLAGNHDLLRGVSYEAAQSPLDPLYLHEQTLALPGTQTVIVGNNGWYDYSLAAPSVADEPASAFAQWKRTFWVDGAIPQPVSDSERMARVLQTTEQALDDAAGKRIIYVTHFVPTPKLMLYPPPGRERFALATGMMGSRHLGELLEKRGVADVVFGHLHHRDADLTVGSTHYHHRPMGYGLKRLHEWTTNDWFTEWRDTLVWLDA